MAQTNVKAARKRRNGDLMTGAQIAALKKPGKHCVGRNLYLVVDDRGNRAFELRYSIKGRQRTLGLGAFDPVRKYGVSAREARDRADDLRKLVKAGVDPHEARAAEQARAAEATEAATPKPTFRTIAEGYIEKQAAGWKGDDNEVQCARRSAATPTHCSATGRWTRSPPTTCSR